MKRLFFVIAIILGLGFSSMGMAEVKAGSVSITPNIGRYDFNGTFEGERDLKNALLFGLRGGYNFTKNLGVEGYFHYVDTELKSVVGNPDVNLYGFGVEGLYHFIPESRLVPFLAIGVGNSHYNTSGMENRNKFTISSGGGLKYFLTESVALRGDVRYLIPLNGRENNLLYTLGVTFAFGATKKASPVVMNAIAPESAPEPEPVTESAPEPEPVTESAPATESEPVGAAYIDIPDTDGDGVPDYMDKCPETPAGVEVDIVGCPPPAVKEKPEVVVMEEAILSKGRVTLNVEFDFDKAIIKKEYHDEIGNLAAVMEKHPDMSILLEGHTDNVGGTKYNQQLSERRVIAVKTYLVEKFGIDAARLSMEGYGESRPIATNATKEGRQKNRRVEAAAEYIITK